MWPEYISQVNRELISENEELYFRYEIFRKATSTIFIFKEKFPVILLPLQPVLTVQRA
jgi:hypothetical protein